METEKIHKALLEADAIVVGADAGLSTSAGFTYSGERFQRVIRPKEPTIKSIWILAGIIRGKLNKREQQTATVEF